MIIEGLVSVIIPVHNRPILVREAISSALSQTYRPIEIIVVDDGSDDETPEILDGMASESSEIRVLRRENGGPGMARETGRQAAKGEFIQYLDSDDLLLPRKFELQVAGLRESPDCGISYGKTHHSGIGKPLRPVAFKRTAEKIQTLFPSLLLSRWWSSSSPLYRRSVTDLIGPWQSLSNEEDWEYEARAGRLGIQLHFCDEFVSVTRWHDDNRLHSKGGAFNPQKLVQRARAHGLIFQHARDAGITCESPEMRNYARQLFHLCRQCGSAGLEAESKRLFDLSREASGSVRRNGWDFLLYSIASKVIGWKAAARLASWPEMVKFF